MANFTENYNLKKPLPEEFYNIEDHNGNMDIIDAALKNLDNTKASIGEDGKILSEQLPDNLSGGTSGGSGASVFYGTIGTEWTTDGETGVKTQTVTIDGVLASHTGISFDVVMTHERTTDGYTAFVEEQNQFLDYITNGDAETVDGGVIFYIYGNANTVEIPFGLVVI